MRRGVALEGGESRTLGRRRDLRGKLAGKLNFLQTYHLRVRRKVRRILPIQLVYPSSDVHPALASPMHVSVQQYTSQLPGRNGTPPPAVRAALRSPLASLACGGSVPILRETRAQVLIVMFS